MGMMGKKSLYGILLILMIALLGAIAGTQAQEPAGASFSGPVMYELRLPNDGSAETEWAALEAQITAGNTYIGLAAGSQVGVEAQKVDGRLIWQGPFSVAPGGELILRFWMEPSEQSNQALPIEVTAQSGAGGTLLARAEPAELVAPDRVAPEDVTSPEAVTVQKIAETVQVTPDDHPWIAYQVIFSNDSGSPAILDQISDTPAPGFQFGGMAYGSELEQQPDDPQALPLIWDGPFAVPGGGTLTLRYWVKATMVEGNFTNSVEATGGGVPVGPDEATVTVLAPNLFLSKDASPDSVSLGDLVTYDVTVANSGGHQGVIDEISDTLPAGLSFDSMDPASDWGTPATTEPLVWTENQTVPAGGERHLIYRVRAGEVGNQTNSVVALDNHGAQVGPAQEQIEVTPVRIFMPVISREEKATTLPMEEEFTTKIPPEWVPFVNYPELDAQDWYYTGDKATWGRYDYYHGGPLSQWALSMYLGEGAQEWTDYKIETTYRAGKEDRNVPKLVGVWFRGTFEERTDNQGGDVGGYMFVLKPDDSDPHAKAYIGHIDPATRQLGFVKDYERQFTNRVYTFYDVTIEVRGANIKVAVDGTQIINWTDPNNTYPQGTVGFVVYQGAGNFDSIRVTPLD
jgi:uncharacterized repeat protein (TIGR01451 family)